MSRWMNETGGKLANGTDPFENDPELEMIRRRVQDLVHTFPLNFTSMLYDIRYKREQLKLRRKQIGDAKTKLDAEKKVKKKKRNKNHKGVSWLLLDSQSASSVLFYLSCFHVVVCQWKKTFNDAVFSNSNIPLVISGAKFCWTTSRIQ